MSAPAILAIDQGTTNSKALLIAEDGQIVARGSAPVPIDYPRPGWAESDSRRLWQSVEVAVDACLEGQDTGRIAAIGISNQRESILLWDRETGAPVGPCIGWQCRRSTERLARMRTDAIAGRVKTLTGLDLDPLFPAAKIGWLLDAIPDVRARADAGQICAGTVDSWVLFNLTGGAVHATDASNASRTQLFDIHKLDWSAELCELFGIPSGILPDVRDSDSVFGASTERGRLPAGIPVHAMIGDSHAALFGHGVRASGTVKATYGTGSSLMTLTDGAQMSAHGLSTTIAWRRGGAVQYALEGNITVSGHAAAWAAGALGFASVDDLSAAACSVGDTHGVYFVPALAGLGAPYWKPGARGIFSGLSLSTGRPHMARAVLEAIAYQIGDVFSAMGKDLDTPLAALSADGGASSNAFLMQLQADILGCPVTASAIQELSAVGAGVMAGVSSGLWTETGGKGLCAAGARTFAPAVEEHQRRKMVTGWADAVRRALEVPEAF